MSTSSKPGGSSVTGGKTKIRKREITAPIVSTLSKSDQSDTSWPPLAWAHPRFRLHRDVL
jgi:hypothetical protein